ncbi:MAG: GNAT family N-acetyltransferase, partial [Clostridia bacterium]|nr:GNAT family N-acetyltransferase [Clostridia bacterium]
RYESENGPFVYPVLTKDNKNIGYVQIAPTDDGWEIGYHIAKKYTGKGYASEAVSSFLPVIAEKKALSVIYGISLKENIASIKVMEKCGFENLYSGTGIYQGERREIVKKIWKKQK